MVKVQRNPIGCMDVFFETDKKANEAKEKLAHTWDVSKKWEKHLRIKVYGDNPDMILKVAEGYMEQLSDMDGFMELQLDISDKMVFVKGEMA